MIEEATQRHFDILRYCPRWLVALWLVACCVFSPQVVMLWFGVMFQPLFGWSFGIAFALTVLCVVWAGVAKLMEQ